MLVKVREVLDGGRHDYLLLSVMDNVIREQLDEYQKISPQLSSSAKASTTPGSGIA